MKIVDHRGLAAILLGRGTEIDYETVDRQVIGVEGDTTLIKITARVRLTFTGRFVTSMDRCTVCAAPADLPDNDALHFVLSHNDGDRLLFPYAEDCDEDRDRYPMKGWRYVEPHGLVCPTCVAEINAAVAEVTKRRKKSS